MQLHDPRNIDDINLVMQFKFIILFVCAYVYV